MSLQMWLVTALVDIWLPLIYTHLTIRLPLCLTSAFATAAFKTISYNFIFRVSLLKVSLLCRNSCLAIVLCS